MPIVENPELYKKAKEIADQTYKKPSAYKSGFIVKKYKELGGTYKDDNQTKDLKRWFSERWKDVGNKEYPVYRPTKLISKNTPLTIDEIDKEQLKKQISLKQKIKGTSNLPKFEEEDKEKQILKYSDPQIVLKNAKKYLGPDTKLYLSTKRDKKYMVLDPNTNKFVHFGQFSPPFEDFTQHKDLLRRDRFKKRNQKWADSQKYTPSYLSYYLLW